MLLFLIAACSNVDGSRFGAGGVRYDANDYVPDTSSGGTDTADTADTSDSGEDTALPETTTEAILLSLTLVWDEDKDGNAYMSAGLEYYDNPDDTNGGKLYITVEQDGDGVSQPTYDVVDYDGWDPEAEEAATDPESELMVFEIHDAGVGTFDTTLSYAVTVMLKDEAGHESEDYMGSLAGE